MKRIFFVSRAFPPVLGGIENHNQQLSDWLGRRCRVELLANRHGKAAIPVFALWAFAVLLVRLRRGDVVVLGDGVLAPLGWLLQVLRRIPVIGIVHGLDVTFARPLYQRWWVRRFLPALAGVVAVSDATREEAIARGVPAGLLHVIPNGVDTQHLRLTPCRPVADLLPAEAQGKTLLLTVGRLVKRKGVAWFVEHVAPKLPEAMVYVVAGDGPERERVTALVETLGLAGRVLLLGRVDEPQKLTLLRSAALFIQPNIVVPGDVEGFGISVIEASACGTPVLAADLQGLRDSVMNEVTGWRLPAGDAVAWQDYLASWTPANFDRSQVAAATEAAFAWESVAARYQQVIAAVAAQRR